MAETVGQLENNEGVKGRKTGILHTYNSNTGEWCILSDGAERFIFNISQGGMRIGDDVSFIPGKGAEYDRAKDVTFSHPSSEALALANKAQHAFSMIMEENMQMLETESLPVSGTIQVMKLTGDKGFGFITPADGGKNIFFHSGVCIGGFNEFKALYERNETGENIKVTFTVQNSPNGRLALDVGTDSLETTV